MSQLNDAILEATGGPTVNDGLAAYYGKTSTESLQDAEFRWLGEQGGISGTIQDRWIEVFGPGQINDIKLAHFSGGNVFFLDNFPLVLPTDYADIGGTTGGITTPGNVALHVIDVPNEGFDFRWFGRVTWASAARHDEFASWWLAPTEKSWNARREPTLNQLQILFSDDKVTTSHVYQANAGIDVVYSGTQLGWIRFFNDPANNIVVSQYSPDDSNGPWINVGPSIDIGELTNIMQAPATVIRVGNDATKILFCLEVHYFAMAKFSGEIVSEFDPSGHAGETSFKGRTGEVWTLDGATTIQSLVTALPVAGAVASYLKGQGITVAGSGVSVWADQSGNGNDLLQGIDADRPTYDAPSGVLTFNGVSQFLKAAPFTLDQPTTIYVLCKQISWSLNDTIFDGDSNIRSRCRQVNSSPGLEISAGVGLGPNNDLAVGTYGVIIAVVNGASSLLQIDNNAPLTGDAGANDIRGFTLGVRGNISNFANVEVVECLLYNTAHDAGQIAQNVDYLTDKSP